MTYKVWMRVLGISKNKLLCSELYKTDSINSLFLKLIDSFNNSDVFPSIHSFLNYFINSFIRLINVFQHTFFFHSFIHQCLSNVFSP